MDFEILGEITVLETIASGRGIRDLRRLQKSYGKGHWRKMKGSARVRLRNGEFALPSFTGTKHTALASAKLNERDTWTNDYETTQTSYKGVRRMRR